MSKLSIFIPAYNAEKTITKVVDRIPENIWKDIFSVWIINDGSSDNSIEVISRLVKQNSKIKIESFKNNRGYGDAVKCGLSKIKNDPIEFGICLHADGQYAPESISDFIGSAKNNSYDILQGSRILPGTAIKGGMPIYKYIFGKCLTFMENIVFNLSMTDYHSGYLCYSKKALVEIPFNNLSSSFEFDLEVIASARKRKLSIGEIGIPTCYADEVSYLNPVKYGLRVLSVLIRYVFGGYGK